MHYITDMIFDHNSMGWFGLSSALIKYDGNQFVELTTSNSSIPGNTVTAVFTDTDDKLWVGTSGYGIGVYYEEQPATSVPINRSNSNSLAAAPVPALDHLRVRIKLDQQTDITLTVFDVLGHKVYQEIMLDQSGEINKIINTNDLASGMYILQAGSGSSILTQRIIVE